MEKRWRILAFAVVCTFCVLFGAGAVFAVDVPEKLRDIPLYEGSTVQQAIDMTNHAMLMAAVRARGDAIADFYKNAMAAKGWTLAFQAEQQNIKMLHFKKDKLILQVTIDLDKGGVSTGYHLIMTSQQ